MERECSPGTGTSLYFSQWSYSLCKYMDNWDAPGQDIINGYLLGHRQAEALLLLKRVPRAPVYPCRLSLISTITESYLVLD